MIRIPKTPILVVDDYPANLIALNAILDERVYDVLEAISGTQALEIALSRDIGVVLLDVQMPLMDGFEVARQLRAHPRTRVVPIIFITAVHLDESETAGGYLRGEDYFSKPFDAGVLLAKVAAYASRYRRRIMPT